MLSIPLSHTHTHTSPSAPSAPSPLRSRFVIESKLKGLAEALSMADQCGTSLFGREKDGEIVRALLKFLVGQAAGESRESQGAGDPKGHVFALRSLNTMVDLELVAVQQYAEPTLLRAFFAGLQCDNDPDYVDEVLNALQKLCERHPEAIYKVNGLEELLKYIHARPDEKIFRLEGALAQIKILCSFVEEPTEQSVKVLTDLLDHEEAKLREGALACFIILVDRLSVNPKALEAHLVTPGLVRVLLASMSPSALSPSSSSAATGGGGGEAGDAGESKEGGGAGQDEGQANKRSSVAVSEGSFLAVAKLVSKLCLASPSLADLFFSSGMLRDLPKQIAASQDLAGRSEEVSIAMLDVAVLVLLLVSDGHERTKAALAHDLKDTRVRLGLLQSASRGRRVHRGAGLVGPGGLGALSSLLEASGGQEALCAKLGIAPGELGSWLRQASAGPGRGGVDWFLFV